MAKQKTMTEGSSDKLRHSGVFTGTSGSSAAIPADYIDAMSLVGPEGFVCDRLEAFKASGVTSLQVAGWLS